MPLETLEHVLALAQQGATIVISAGGPSDVAGLANLEPRRQRFRRAAAALHRRAVRGDDLEGALRRAGIARERLVDHGLLFARRSDAQGRIYFLSNRSDRAVEGWVPLDIPPQSLMLFDPMTRRSGGVQMRRAESETVEVYLQIPPGESLIVASSPRPARAQHQFYTPGGDPVIAGQSWSVRFVEGGPGLPATRTIDHLVSWTQFERDEAVRSFSGTATYTTTFPAPRGAADAWRLDLGRVHESAKVRLNGVDLGVLIGPAFRLVIGKETIRDTNVLEVSVTNLSANRIADLDRRGVLWKRFYNVNMPARLPENRGADGLFTAAKWEPVESGLIGPVTLTPLQRVPQ